MVLFYIPVIFVFILINLIVIVLFYQKNCIDTLYIDMTFFEPTIRQLPEREQACQKLIHFIQQYDNR